MGRQAVVFNRSLAEMAKVLNSPVTAGEKLLALVQSASRALGVRGCSLMLLDAKKRKLIHAATYGLSDRYVRGGLVDVDKSLPEIMEGKTALVVDAASDPRVQFAEMARLEKVLYEILSKATGHSYERIEKDCDRDNFMSAIEAKQYGLIDEVTVRNKAEPAKK